MRNEGGFSRHWHFEESRFCGREWNARISRTKGPFSYTRIDSWVLFLPRHYFVPVRMTQIFAASNECTRPFNVHARNLYVKTLARFFPSIFTQPLSLSRLTYFCPKLSRACQPESISFGYLSAFYCRLSFRSLFFFQHIALHVAMWNRIPRSLSTLLSLPAVFSFYHSLYFSLFIVIGYCYIQYTLSFNKIWYIELCELYWKVILIFLQFSFISLEIKIIELYYPFFYRND